MTSRSLTENEIDNLLKYLNSSRETFLTAELLKDSDKILNVEIIETICAFSTLYGALFP